METLMLTTHHLPLDSGALPAAVVVATVTTDKRLLGNASPTHLLTQLAGKLGLLSYAIIDGGEIHTPGYQLDLFKH